MNANQFLIAHQYGMSRAELEQLIKLERLCLVLCRFDEGRLLCPAQDAPEIVKRLESTGWGIRDVSPAGERLAQARIELARDATAQAIKEACKRGLVISDRVMFNESDCGGAFDGYRVISGDCHFEDQPEGAEYPPRTPMRYEDGQEEPL